MRHVDRQSFLGFTILVASHAAHLDILEIGQPVDEIRFGELTAVNVLIRYKDEKKTYCGDKMTLRTYYLHTGKATYLIEWGSWLIGPVTEDIILDDQDRLQLPERPKALGY